MSQKNFVLGIFVGTPILYGTLAAFCFISMSSGVMPWYVNALSTVFMISCIVGILMYIYWFVAMCIVSVKDFDLIFQPDDYDGQTESFLEMDLTPAEANDILEEAKEVVARMKGYRQKNPFKAFLTMHVLPLARERVKVAVRVERQAKIDAAKEQTSEGEEDGAQKFSVGYRHAASAGQVPGEETRLKGIREKIAKAKSLNEAMKMVNEFEDTLKKDDSVNADHKASLLAKIKDEMYGRYYEE